MEKFVQNVNMFTKASGKSFKVINNDETKMITVNDNFIHRISYEPLSVTA